MKSCVCRLILLGWLQEWTHAASTNTITNIAPASTFLFLRYYSSFSSSRPPPPTGLGTDFGVSELAANCLREVIELAMLNTFCYPKNFLTKLQPEPLRVVSLCVNILPRAGFQP